MIIVLLISSVTMEDKLLNVKYGEIIITDYNSCIIESNGVTYNYTVGNATPGLWFGLINYDCDNVKGNIISNFECKPCGVFCVYNEIVPGCKQYLFPLIIGVIIGIMMGILLLILSIKYGHKMIGSIIYKINLIRQKKVDNTRMKMRERMLLEGAELDDIKFKDQYSLNSKGKKLVSKNRDIIRQKAARRATSASYIEPTIIQHEDQPQLYNISDEVFHIYDNANARADKNSKSSVFKPSAPIKTEAYKLLQEEIDMMASYGSGGIDNHGNTNTIENTSTRHNRPRQNHNINRDESIKKGLGLLAAGVLLTSGLDTTNACDQTLFIKSSGKVCDNHSCKDISMYSFPIQTGQSICFKDSTGDSLSLKISSSYMRYRFNALYKTSDFKIETKSYYKCKGKDECWEGNCNRFDRGTGFEDNRHIDSKVSGYRCLTDSLGCDTWCYHHVSCTYLSWYINEIGPQYTVYYRDSEMWEVVVEVKYKGIVRKSMLNVNNPTIDVSDLNIPNIKELPIYVTSFNSERSNVENGVVMSSEGLINTRVSMLNLPENDIIGDYQIDLKNITRTFDIENVKCTSTSCRPICTISQPKIQRVLSVYKQENLIKDYKYYSSKTIVEYKQNVNSLVNIMIGNIDLNNLQITPAKCSINLEMTYSCSGCNIRPYAIFRSSGIITEGTVPYDSNCTFTKRYLSCNSEVYKMELLDNRDVCYLHIIPFNQTLHLYFNYTFIGSMIKFDTVISSDYSLDIIDHIVKNEGFWNGLISTFTTFAFMSLSIAAVIRFIKIWSYNRASRELMGK